MRGLRGPPDDLPVVKIATPAPNALMTTSRMAWPAEEPRLDEFAGLEPSGDRDDPDAHKPRKAGKMLVYPALRETRDVTRPRAATPSAASAKDPRLARSAAPVGPRGETPAG
jgi:hypothetical protein